MKPYKRIIATTSCLFSLLALTPTFSNAESTTKTDITTASDTSPAKKSKATSDSHPVIANTINNLEAARKHLNEAGHDFGGHKEKAIKACDDAIEQLKDAEKFDKK
jgi:hypothetical protein